MKHEVYFTILIGLAIVGLGLTWHYGATPQNQALSLGYGYQKLYNAELEVKVKVVDQAKQIVETLNTCRAELRQARTSDEDQAGQAD